MLYLIIASLIWSFSFGIIKTELTGIPSTVVAFLRLAISTIIFIPFLSLKKLNGKITYKLLLIGALQYGIMYIAYIAAFNYLKAYEIAILTIFTPIYLVLFSSLLAKRINYIYFAAGVLSVIGTGVIIFHSSELSLSIIGFLLVQISNISFATGQILYKRVMKDIENSRDKNIFAILYLGATIITLFALLFTQPFNYSSITVTQSMALLYLGILPSGIGFFLWNYGARKVNDGALGVMNNLKIPLAVLVSLIVFGETTDLLKLTIGSAIIIISILLTEKNNIFERK